MHEIKYKGRTFWSIKEFCDTYGLNPSSTYTHFCRYKSLNEVDLERYIIITNKRRKNRRKNIISNKGNVNV